MPQSTEVQHIHGEREESRSSRPLGASQGGALALPAAHRLCGPPTDLRVPPDPLCLPPAPPRTEIRTNPQKAGFGSGSQASSLALTCHLPPQCSPLLGSWSRRGWGRGGRRLGSCPRWGLSSSGSAWGGTGGGQRWRLTPWTPGGPGGLERGKACFLPHGPTPGCWMGGRGLHLGQAGTTLPPTSDGPCLGSWNTRPARRESSLEGVSAASNLGLGPLRAERAPAVHCPHLGSSET